MCPENYREHLCCQAWTEQARPQHGSNVTVRGTEAGRRRTLWASECGCVSFSFCLFSPLSPGPGPGAGRGRADRPALFAVVSQPFRLGQFVEGSTEANPSMLWDNRAACLYYGRFSSNPIQRVSGSPHRQQSEPSLWVLLRRPCRHSQVLTTGSACSHAAQQCSV